MNVTSDLPAESNQQGANSSPSLPQMSSLSAAHLSATNKVDIKQDNDIPFGNDLQRRIEEALLSKAVISTIVKAVSEAILENVTNEVYRSIDFDIQKKTEKIAELDLKLVSM